MKHDDFPALYRSADLFSLRSQKNFFRALSTHLILLILAAAISSANSAEAAIALAQGFAITGALLCSIYLAACRPDKHWYTGRAAAESIKTLTWRYVCRAEPFHTEDHIARVEFSKKLKAVLVQNTDVAAKLVEFLDDSQISPSMEQIRRSSMTERLHIYKTDRISDQRAWYAKKAKFNANASATLFVVLISLNTLGVAFAFGKVLNPVASAWPTDVFLAAAACVLAWMQARRFSELSSSYALAAHEIGFVGEQAKEIADEVTFSHFVGDAENAFSREHTQWVARKDS